MSKTRKLILIGVLIAQAMVLSYLESFFPPPMLTPGAKLGLANIITLTAINIFSLKISLLIMFLRIVLVAITFGNPFSMLYALGGGILSFAGMYVLSKVFYKDTPLLLISIVGAILHNTGQVLVAMFVLKTPLIITYLPPLLFIAVPTGIFVGFVAKTLIKYLRRNYVLK